MPKLLIIISCLVLPNAVFAAERFEFEQMKMAVPVRIVLYTDSSEQAKTLADEAFRRFDELNGIMSDYENDSEIVRLAMQNDRRFSEVASGEPESEAADGWMPLSEDLFRVLKAARHYAEISDGAFDVTVSPMVQIWRRAKRLRRLPTETDIENAKARVGASLWELREPEREMRFLKKGMRFDLGGIAKGYAIDRAFEQIQAAGVQTVLIDAGGDMRLGKAPPDGWKIGFGSAESGENPLPDIELADIAIAVSGDKFQYFELDGKRFSHIIDPRTGRPLVDQCLVTVFAPTTIEADALASALSVLGPEKGQALLETLPKVKAHFFQRQ